MRVLVQVPHIAIGRRIVELEIVLFNVFAVIAFRGGQTEGSSLRKGSPVFHRPREKFRSSNRSQIPARPSSPHR